MFKSLDIIPDIYTPIREQEQSIQWVPTTWILLNNTSELLRKSSVDVCSEH